MWKHIIVLYTKRISFFLRNSLYYTFVGELNESMRCESDGLSSRPGPVPPLTRSFIEVNDCSVLSFLFSMIETLMTLLPRALVSIKWVVVCQVFRTGSGTLKGLCKW